MGVYGLRARNSDWDPIRGSHQGQPSCTARTGRTHDLHPTASSTAKIFLQRGRRPHTTPAGVRELRLAPAPRQRWQKTGMQAVYRLAQNHERGQAIAHQRAKQAKIFQRSVRQLMRPELSPQIGKTHRKSAPTPLVAGIERGARKCVLNRCVKIGCVLADHGQCRKHGGKISPVRGAGVVRISAPCMNAGPHEDV